MTLYLLIMWLFILGPFIVSRFRRHHPAIVVFLVHNQQHQLEWLIRRHFWRARWHGAPSHLIVIDINSSDATAQIVTTLSQKYPITSYRTDNLQNARQQLSHIQLEHHSTENWSVHEFMN